MSSDTPEPVAVARPESPRIDIAAAAAAAAAGCAGVAGLDAGPLGRHLTRQGGRRVAGVTVMPAGQPGRYDVDLHVRAQAVPLHELAAVVRGVVRAAVTAQGLGDALGDVDVAFTDLELPARYAA